MPAVTKKSVPAGRRSRQRGAALMIFSIIFVLAALAYLLSSLGPELSEARRERQTHDALAQARDALIGYALKYREDQMADGQPDRVYGYLPLPDLGTSRNNNASCANEGCAAANFGGNGLNTTVIGRLPWRTLGLEPLRDGNAECLWYIVSGSHQNQQRVTPMNWDVLSHLDVVVANGGAALAAALTSAHERPVAVIFSPGPPLPGQDRSLSATDSVTNCGGNYEAKNYFDPVNAAAMDGVTNYLGDTNSASSVTDSDTSRKPLALQGKVFTLGGNYLPNACEGSCSLLANDAGLALTGDQLFGAIRKHANFRTDINSLMDRITDCLRDQALSGYAKIGGADNDSCYGSNLPPRGYFPNYREMLFVAGGATMNVDGNTCAGSLLFSNERNNTWNPAGEPSGNTPTCPKSVAGNPYQCRTTAGEKTNASNYLEGINLSNFGAGTNFSGHEMLERVSASQSRHQDIVRCIPTTRSFVTTQSPGLVAAGFPQLATYTPGTRTITLGQGIAAALGSSLANFLYGCAWRPETHTLGGGLRSYFTFRINDAGGASWPTLGFTFTIVDGDNNGTDACGAAAQHLGYSGNNTESAFIVQPKVAVEVDLRREIGFNPTLTDHLLNGRNDPPSPSYRGGHVAIDYWGGETSFSAMPFAALPAPKCVAPAFDPGFGTNCYLPQEEDDNVHARAPLARAGFPVPPANPPIPATELAVPPNSPAGAYKLDPALVQVPIYDPADAFPKYFHVRVELTRTGYTRVATAANLDLNAPGNPVNGVTLVAGDRVWVRYQTVSMENGLYVWNGAAVPMTRIVDGDSAVSYSLPRVRVATTGNIDINSMSEPVIIDGVYLADGDRVLVKDQAVASQNGIYFWRAAYSRLERSSDADSPAELAGMVVEVQQGTLNARSIWRQNATSLAVGTTALSWTNFRVKVATAATIDLNGPGAEIDGIRIKLGDRVLVKNNGASNGVYRWNGATASMTLDTDVIAGSSIVQIQQGSEATALWFINGAASLRLPTVRVASKANLNLAAPGGIIDGIAMAPGDRVLVKDQAIASENGIYQWNGAAIAMTRTADADAPAEIAGALSQVIEGSDVGRAFRQTALATDGTLGTSAIQWLAIDRSSSYLLEIWILLDSPSYSGKIAAMQDTTRPMNFLYPTFTPHMQDRPVIPYPFRNARPGFTIGQRTSINDQTVTIGNYFTTWLE
ncbi:MAG: hypothetical protein KJZ90_08055 [Rhodocyclaceae bacterium]|nr:hypothetical protein [Rhodocyclaceae bacterium]